MTTMMAGDDGWRRSPWRLAMWGGAAALLLLPLVAMQFEGSGVNWDWRDFLVMGVLLLLAGVAVELLVRACRGLEGRAGAVVAVGTGFLLVWINLAVGIIGPEDEDANVLYLCVLTLALGGGIGARLRPEGMVPAMLATAAATALVAIPAYLLGGVRSLLLTGVFVAAWGLSAWLYRQQVLGRSVDLWRLGSGIVLALGLALLGAMIAIEGEPTAVPLVMILLGAGGLAARWWRNRR